MDTFLLRSTLMASGLTSWNFQGTTRTLCFLLLLSLPVSFPSSSSLLGAEARELQATDVGSPEVCDLVVDCVELECCGMGTTWVSSRRRCLPGSPSFDGVYPEDYDHGCVKRKCFNQICCGAGTMYLGTECITDGGGSPSATSPTASPTSAPTEGSPTPSPTEPSLVPSTPPSSPGQRCAFEPISYLSQRSPRSFSQVDMAGFDTFSGTLALENGLDLNGQPDDSFLDLVLRYEGRQASGTFTHSRFGVENQCWKPENYLLRGFTVCNEPLDKTDATVYPFDLTLSDEYRFRFPCAGLPDDRGFKRCVGDVVYEPLVTTRPPRDFETNGWGSSSENLFLEVGVESKCVSFLWNSEEDDFKINLPQPPPDGLPDVFDRAAFEKNPNLLAAIKLRAAVGFRARNVLIELGFNVDLTNAFCAPTLLERDFWENEANAEFEIKATITF